MSFKIAKPLVLKIYCLARQAERSFDFTLGSDRQWQRLRQYYGEGRLSELRQVVSTLEGFRLPGNGLISRKEVYSFGVWEIVTSPWNRFRNAWSFSIREILFMVQTLKTAVRHLEREEKPADPSLVETRRDLYTVEGIIEKKLVGVPALKVAARIEHFCQADHIQSIKMDELIQDTYEIAGECRPENFR